jgi:hypothetical protein
VEAEITVGIFASFCINQTLVQTRSGDDPTTPPSAGTTIMGSVQAAGSARLVAHGQEASLVSHIVMYDGEPLDTSNARGNPRIRLEDQITWQVDPADPLSWRNLYALGPARDEGGGGVAWSVDCQERP